MCGKKNDVARLWDRRRKIICPMRKTYFPLEKLNVGDLKLEYGYDTHGRKFLDYKFSFYNKKNQVIVLYFSELAAMRTLQSGASYSTRNLSVNMIKVNDQKMVSIRTYRGFGLEKSTICTIKTFLELYLCEERVKRHEPIHQKGI